jgi:protein gp37
MPIPQSTPLTDSTWWKKSWNPVTGCTPFSPGCKNCYAERMARRLAGRAGYDENDPFVVQCREDRLDEPLQRKRSTVYFTCSMGDLFHGEVPDEYLDCVMQTMVEASQHVFKVCTKRAARMAQYLNDWVKRNGPLPDHIWVGVTVENQAMADRRIPLLLSISAAVRFLSVEPLLGPVSLKKYLKRGIDWVIVGGESGHCARPLHPEWVENLLDECRADGVAFFFKQWGEWAPFAPASALRTSDREATAIIYGKKPIACVEPSGNIPITWRGKDIVGVGDPAPGSFWLVRTGAKKAGKTLRGSVILEYPVRRQSIGEVA